MRKKNNDNNSQNLLMNKITVNKKANILNKTLRQYNYRRPSEQRNDMSYYKKGSKSFKYKNPTLFSKNKRNKFSEEKINVNKMKYYNKEPYKKTINTYSNDNRYKDRNILEELQHNKYLRPMLVTTNINTKLLKCKIEKPMKNICTLSLRNYFSNSELPFQKSQSPHKFTNDLYDEENANSSNINNRTVMDRFNIYNNDFSPSNEVKFCGEKKNSTSFIYGDDTYNFDNYLLRYTVNNIKKYSNQFDNIKNDKDFYYENKNWKSNNFINNKSPKIYRKNVIALRGPFNLLYNDLNNKSYSNLKINNPKENRVAKQINKNKLVEKFIKVLNKFFLKYKNEIYHLFFNNLINFKKKIKIYFKKKNNRINIKKLSVKEKNSGLKYDANFKKFQAKSENDLITNMNNISFSNELKSPSYTNYLRINNNNFNKQSISFILSEQKHKKYCQSPEDSLNKYKIGHIRKKVIVQQKRFSGSQNKLMVKSPSLYETRESGGDIFIYKKKNLNNDNLFINKNIKNNEIFSSKPNNDEYDKIINNNKKGKIINIDINLGKPINIINDHSSLQDFILESPQIYKLNTTSSKFIKNKKRKKKARSGSKTKIKPPLSIKRFEEEDDFEFNNNFYINSRAHSSIRKFKNDNNSFYSKIINDNNDFIHKKKNGNKKSHKNNDENKISIRFNYFPFLNSKSASLSKKKFKYLKRNNNISILLKNKEKNKKKEINNKSPYSTKKIKKNKASKIYINCTRFLEKIFKKIIKRKVFVILIKHSKNNSNNKD